MKIRLRFYECEHGGDLQNYEDSVVKAGGTVLDSRCDEDSEAGIIIAEVADLPTFKTKLAETPGGDFLSGISQVKA